MMKASCGDVANTKRQQAKSWWSSFTVARCRDVEQNSVVDRNTVTHKRTHLSHI